MHTAKPDPALREQVLDAGPLISAEEAERRVLIQRLGTISVQVTN